MERRSLAQSGMIALLVVLGACMAQEAAAGSAAPKSPSNPLAAYKDLLANLIRGRTSGARRGALAGALVNGSYVADGGSLNQYDPAANPQGVPSNFGFGNTNSPDNVPVGVNFLFGQVYTPSTGCPNADSSKGFTSLQTASIAPASDTLISISLFANGAGTCELPAATLTLKSRSFIGCSIAPLDLGDLINTTAQAYPMAVSASVSCNTVTIKYAKSPSVNGDPNVVAWAAAWNLTCPPKPTACSPNATCCENTTGCPKAVGTVCGASQGQCAAELVCDGSSAECKDTGSSSSGFHCWVSQVVDHIHQKLASIGQFFGHLGAKWHN